MREAFSTRAATRLARKLAGKGYGIAFAFVEGGYLTLEAAYKNIKAGANIKMIIPIIRNLAIEAANSFVAGATGKGGAGLGGPSGQRWSQSAFIYAQKEHPDITLAEFQAALSSDSPGARLWREQARAKINYLTRLALFQCFQRNPPDWADASSVKLLRETLFKGKLHDPSELSVKPPELYKIKKNPGYTKLPEHLTRRKEVPLVIQDEVRRRLRNHQPSGKIDHRDGITYWFRYNPASKTIEVYGEDMTSFVPFHG